MSCFCSVYDVVVSQCWPCAYAKDGRMGYWICSQQKCPDNTRRRACKGQYLISWDWWVMLCNELANFAFLKINQILMQDLEDVNELNQQKTTPSYTLPALPWIWELSSMCDSTIEEEHTSLQAYVCNLCWGLMSRIYTKSLQGVISCNYCSDGRVWIATPRPWQYMKWWSYL